MDENKSPQDILNEIFEKSQSAEPSLPPPWQPPEDEPPPGGPAEKRGAEGAARLLLWLGAALAAALLVLGVCLFQLTRLNHRLDELQQAVEAVRAIDALQKENEPLQEQLDQAEQKNELLSQMFEDASTQLSIRNAQKLRAEYLVYLGRFMDSGEYPMAALVAMLSADRYFGELYIDSQYVALSPIESAQYQAYTQELAERGYLEETVDPAHIPLDSQFPPTRVGFAAQWDPEENPDMAALGILWCAMERYYVLDDPAGAAQYFVNWQEYLMDSPPEHYFYLDRLYGAASGYLTGLHEQLVYALTDQGYLAWADGAEGEPGKFEYGPRPVARPDILEIPPFLHVYYYGEGNQ